MNEFNAVDQEIVPGARRSASGFRKETAAGVHWRAFADTFSGLPENVAHPHQLLDALRQARAGLKLSDSELSLITDLYAATQPRDWEAGRRPMAWPSNDTLASRQGKSISAIQRMIARLIARGLLVMRESPTGKRYGFRGPDGHVTRAFGFDLSLLALRHAEFRAISAAREAQQTAIREARRRATIARKRLIITIEAAEEAGLWSTFWENAEAQVLSTAELSKLRDPARLAQMAAALETLLAEALDVFRAATKNPAERPATDPDNSSDETDQRRAHRTGATLKNTTDSHPNYLLDQAHQRCNPRPEAGTYPEFEARRLGQPATTRDPLRHVEPDELLANVSELTAAREDHLAGWQGLAAACGKLRLRYEVGHRLWEDAEERIGPRMALAILAIMIARGRDHYTSPGGCFRRMVERQEAGTLNLLPSYFGLMARKGEAATEPVSAPEPSGPRSIGAIAGRLKRLN